MTFKEWFESRRPFYWVKLFASMPSYEGFRHVEANTYSFEGETYTFPPGDTPDTDRHMAFAYLAGYLKWCANPKHQQDPGPFEDLVESPSSDD